jgi:predicted ATPase/signal transduction histidine kinase
LPVMKGIGVNANKIRGSGIKTSQSLHTLLGTPMEPGRFLQLAVGMAAALAELHQQGIIHKHLTPDCIFIDPKTNSVTITGYSPASLRPLAEYPSLKAVGETEGMPAYMSPEQTGRMNRTVDYRTDFYSLGVVFYQMLTGRLPFNADNILEWVHCHIARMPVPPGEVVPEVSAVLSEFVMKLLAKDAEDRYQTASGQAADLKNCLRQWEASNRIEPFPLGTEDIVDRLLIPQKLYGRDREFTILRDAFTRVLSTGNPEVIMVAGYSGSGKTTLIRELHKTVLSARGYFVSGKFDPSKRTIPYPALPQVFRELSPQILSESEERVARWKRRIQEALGSNGQLLVDVIPELALIIGPQPPVPELPPIESRNRFTMVFREFVRVFTQKERPLVIFLDDLQWIDIPELQLLTYIVTHSEMKHLLLIGAYRDNEVEPSHPLIGALEEIRRSKASLQIIPLSSLSMEALSQFLTDTFHTDRGQVEPLTRLVYEKTGGNPFFVIQFVKMLSDEGLVRFDNTDRRWGWDIDRIREKGYTDNVADLMAGKLGRLSKRTVEEMRLAACLSSRFDLRTLALISGTSDEETRQGLAEAVREGLLLRSNGDYSFLHDRIQEAAYSLIPEAERPRLHLRIGRMLVSRLPEGEIEERIFALVNQLNRGAGLITDSREKEALAQMNFRAGRKAKASSAFSSARNYFAQCVALLPPDAWSSRYEETFAAHLELAECEFLTGNFASETMLTNLLFANARSAIDRATVYRLRIRLHQIAGRAQEAVTAVHDALRLLGVGLPDSDEAIQTATEAQIRKVTVNLRGRRIADLVDAPKAADPTIQMIISLIAESIPSTYIASPRDFALLTSKGVNASLCHGNTAESSELYSAYAVLLVSILGDIPSGFEFSVMALNLIEKFDNPKPRGAVLMRHGFFVNHWRRHIATSLPHLDRSFLACRELGDFVHAGYSILMRGIAGLEKGDPIVEVLEQFRRGAAFSRESHNEQVYQLIRLWRQFVICLQGLTREPTSFENDAFDEAGALAYFREVGHGSAVASYYIMKQTTAFIHGKYATALKSAVQAGPVLQCVSGTVSEASHHFYHALALTVLYPESSAVQQQEFRRILDEKLSRFKLWADNCPENFENRYALIAAEIARIEGREAEAGQLYERAIRSAHENGFVQNEAIANELTSKFYRALGFLTIADAYIRNARSCYVRWGADGKVRQLDELYPRLREEERAAVSRIGQVDAVTVVKASQAISGEIHTSSLLDTLMRIVIKSAGAQKGCLLLVRGDDLSIEAEAWVEGKEINVLHEVPFRPLVMLPESIINYVKRTRETVILDDTSQQTWLTSDDYLIRNKPVSVLCLPLLRQAHLIGVLYLENNLVRGAFTPDRITVLEVLTAQAAISLENSRLYASLQKSREELELRVAERTRELSEANARLQELDRLKSLFIASMSHELRTPLNSVIGFSTLLLEEWFGSLNAEQKENLSIILRSGKHLLSLINDVIDVSKIEAGKMESVIEEFDLRNIIGEAISTVRKDVQDKELTLNVDLPRYRMQTDRRRLFQCVLNLLSNAVKFTEQGSITVAARPHGEFINISVADTGIGIKKNDMSKLFHAFARLDSPLRGTTPGTGLGLYLTRKLATEVLKGEIRGRSRYGRGTIFTLRIPVRI